MSAVVAHEMSGFDCQLKEKVDETDGAATGGGENAFSGGIRGLAGATLESGGSGPSAWGMPAYLSTVGERPRLAGNQPRRKDFQSGDQLAAWLVVQLSI
jgi:hypothetical protein